MHPLPLSQVQLSLARSFVQAGVHPSLKSITVAIDRFRITLQPLVVLRTSDRAAN